MRTPFILIVGSIVAMLTFMPVTVSAAGQAPDPKICADAANLPQDVVTQGGCLAIARAKGNCQACHAIPGIASGNIATSLAGVNERFPDKARLRAQIENPLQFNAKSVMPPYGLHEILTPGEIDKILAWLTTL